MWQEHGVPSSAPVGAVEHSLAIYRIYVEKHILVAADVLAACPSTLNHVMFLSDRGFTGLAWFSDASIKGVALHSLKKKLQKNCKKNCKKNRGTLDGT